MPEHPIQGLMKTAMENIKEMVDVNTIIGEPVEADGNVILPISKVGFGFVSGGSEFKPSSSEKPSDDYQEELPFGGGSGGGVSITPVAFLVVGKTGVRLVPLESSTHLYDRILDLTPQVLEKLQNMMKQSKQDKNKQGQDDLLN